MQSVHKRLPVAVVQMHSGSSEAEEENEPDGVFAFRRKAGCVYHTVGVQRWRISHLTLPLFHILSSFLFPLHYCSTPQQFYPSVHYSHVDSTALSKLLEAIIAAITFKMSMCNLFVWLTIKYTILQSHNLLFPVIHFYLPFSLYFSLHLAFPRSHSYLVSVPAAPFGSQRWLALVWRNRRRVMWSTVSVLPHHSYHSPPLCWVGTATGGTGRQVGRVHMSFSLVLTGGLNRFACFLNPI